MLKTDVNRKIERELLGLVAITLIIGWTIVASSTELAKPVPLAGVLFGCCIIFIILHGLLRYLKHGGDPLLFPIAGMLTVIGLVFVYRLQPTLLPFQLTWFAAGATGFAVITCWLRKPEQLRLYKYIIGIGGLLLMLLTITFGVNIGGNKSWLVLGPLSFEPAEFAKILLVIFLAGYLEEKGKLLADSRWGTEKLALPHPLHLGPMLVMWGIALILLVIEKDLGAALLYYSTFLTMLYMASGRFFYVGLGSVLMILGGWLSYHLFSHVKVRFDIWLNPWADPEGIGYQIVQSLFALGTGGILGTGLSTGSPELVPAVHTDFVFAAIGEELGLAGTLMILLIYVLLVYRGFRAAMLAKNEFCALLAAGLSSLLAWQTFVIIGGVTKLVPLTGVTLPFISYGGSSMLASFIILGLLHNISENG